MTTLFHWSPWERRSSINRDGLLPGQRNIDGPTWHDPDRPELGEFLQPAVCFSPDPMTAWRYSHGTWKSSGVFDLWQVTVIDSDTVKRRREDGRIVEVRIHNPVPRTRLLWVAERHGDQPPSGE